MNKHRPPYFENLDALRFFAFFLVFIRHYFDFSAYQPSPGFENYLLEKFAMNGRLGVNLFFVLSGFLITYLLIYEKQNTGSINARNFYVRRILRIWPLYFLIIVLNFFVLPLLTHKFSMAAVKEHIAYYIFFINNFDILKTGFVGIGNDGLAILWSIAIEEQFYFVWPVLILVINKKYLSYLFIFLIFASLAFRSMYVDNKFVIYFHTLSVMSDLAIGGFLAYAAFYSTGFITLINKIKKPQILLIYITLILAITFHGQWSQLNAFTKIFERFALSLLFAFVIAEQCFLAKPLFKFGKFKTAGKLGIITYGLYCLHLLNITFVQKMNLVFHIDQTNSFVFYSEFCLTLLLSVGTSYLCYRYFEKFFLNLKHKFTSV